MMFILLVSLFELFSISSGSVPCVSGATNQYQCVSTNALNQGPVCISSADRCSADNGCECPWCDDQWNCPTFDGCVANGGFVCSTSFIPGTNEVWACIPADWKCDGIWDCPSGEDEGSQNCDVNNCAGNHNLTYWYQCSDTGRCITINSVGNGEIDCVNGEDENPTIIQQVKREEVKGIINEGTPAPTHSPPTDQPTPSDPLPTPRPTREPTPAPTKTKIYQFGIDLVIELSGIDLGTVCTGWDARFESLEVAVALALSLKQEINHVSSTCQRSPQSRLLHSSLNLESESRDSGEVNIYPRNDHTVFVKIGFTDQKEYMKILKGILKVHNQFREDSSSHEWDRARKSVSRLSYDIQVALSDLLEEPVGVKVTGVSGTV